MTRDTLPANLDRVVLVNPTKYLGNLLLAGGLIQDFAAWCQQRDIAFRVVLDESFRALCEDSFAAGSVTWFPRRAIAGAGLWEKARLYRGCLKQLRDFKADLAFNIEEDSAASHLTRLSGAGFRLGCSRTRHRGGYDRVLPIVFEGRPADEAHRWFSYADVFAALGMPRPASPGYLRLPRPSRQQEFRVPGVDFSRPLVAIHGGATKAYKQWPPSHFGRLCALVRDRGMQPVLIGAGAGDRAVNRQIVTACGDHVGVIDLCDRLSLEELARFLPQCRYMIGNDSGPAHLASALGVAGTVIFGPTNMAIWKPLGAATRTLQNNQACEPGCSKGHCLADYRCLRGITPETVAGLLPATD